MEVERIEALYKPIRITLHTKEEEEAMWHLMNMGANSSLKQYETRRPLDGVKVAVIKKFKSRLWDDLERLKEN